VGGREAQADRESADAVAAAWPAIRTAVRENRGFLRRAVTFLAGEVGIRQFLDVGTGLPTANNVHEVAQRIAPQSRIVYVDNDPLVLVHARALLTSSPEGPAGRLPARRQLPGAVAFHLRPARSADGCEAGGHRRE
jgi:S-adenosyl methyltransferase